MSLQTVPVWKQSPFIRILIPLIHGILVSWYVHVDIRFAWGISIFPICVLILLNFNKTFTQFRYNWAKGILLNILIFGIGLLLLSCADDSGNKKSFNHVYEPGDIIIATLEEPLTEKSKTFKAEASIQLVIRSNSFIRVRTNILLYIEKDSTINSLAYGSRIIFLKSLQNIKNSGKPGTFDYFCSLHPRMQGQIVVTP